MLQIILMSSWPVKDFPPLFWIVFFPVELHDQPDMNGLLAATSLEGCLPNAMGVNCVDPDILHEQWASPHTLSNVNSSMPKELRSESSYIISEFREQNIYASKELNFSQFAFIFSRRDSGN